MHALALAMHRQGHQVSGSDDEIYEPSRTRLAAAGLLPGSMGWDPDRITPALDKVVLGMHARSDNPELIRAQELGLRIESFPEFMYAISKDKMRIVVAGSHGKTTTSGMIAHALHENKIPADRMIGASIGSLEPVTLTDAPVIVLEGDEYLSSPLDPRAKFLHYDPDVVIITGIAWDHMNVFPTHEAYIAPFRELISSLRTEATLIYCATDPELMALVERIDPPCTRIAYDSLPYEMGDTGITAFDGDHNHYSMRVFGAHNMQNMSAARFACAAIGLDEQSFLKGMQSFTGASKRLQVLCQNEGSIAYLDFAHAPSKVKATMAAVRERHPDALILAVLELHTFSSLNPAFLPQYSDALNLADEKIVFYSPHTLEIKKLPPLSTDQLAAHFNATDLKTATTAEELKQLVLNAQATKPMILLWMSSGRFDGLDIAAVSEIRLRGGFTSRTAYIRPRNLNN
jgi:UDP-N-acetylmuramate: L-alanyl-gamma-D-glutamyl-meso-diaminopimelate ligase